MRNLIHFFKNITSQQLFLLIAFVGLVSINPRVNGWNEASRMALTQSLVERGTFIIDASEFAGTGDKVFINNHFYSDKPPVPSMLGALVYWPLYHLGLRLDYGWNLSYYLIILFTVKLFWLSSIWAFRKIMLLQGTEAGRSNLLALIFAFGSLMFTWSATFNNHSLAASCLTLGLWGYLAGSKYRHYGLLAFAGFMLGLAGSMDVPTLIYLLGFAYLMLKKFGLKRETWLFAVAALLPISLYLVMNFNIARTILPVQMIPEYFQFEGSVWGEGVKLNTFTGTILYGMRSLFGAAGFVWYNPLLILLIPALIRMIRETGEWGSLAGIGFISSIILIGYYIIFTQNYSGWSYSIRWFVPVLPFIFLGLPGVYQSPKQALSQRIVLSLVALSILISVIGLINPWSNQDVNSIPFCANIQQLFYYLY